MDKMPEVTASKNAKKEKKSRWGGFYAEEQDFYPTSSNFHIKLLTSCSKNLSSSVFSPGLVPAPSNRDL